MLLSPAKPSPSPAPPPELPARLRDLRRRLWKPVRNCLPFLQTLRLALRRELRLRRLAARVGGAQTLVIRDRRVGFFSVYFQVLGALALCERTGRRLILRFDQGLYFDPARPEAGWFDYFFDTLPPLLPAGGQIPGDACTLFNEGDLVELARLGESLPRRRAFGLSRLLPPRPCVTQIVQPHLDRFAACGLVLGIHYRGTDKVHNAVEALRTGYAEVLGIVRELERRGLCFHVFLATDEQRFADALREAVGERLILAEAARGVDKPVHFGVPGRTPYRLGLEALCDAILLSRCDFLVRTESNLSLASLFFNPSLESINVSPSHFDKQDLARLADRAARGLSRAAARRRGRDVASTE